MKLSDMAKKVKNRYNKFAKGMDKLGDEIVDSGLTKSKKESDKYFESDGED